MKHRRRHLLPLVLPLLLAAVLGLGGLLSLLPGRGVKAPLAPAAETREPGFADYFATGVHLMKIGLPRDAAVAFEAASRLRPHVPEARVNLGYARLEAGDFAGAEAAFLSALELRPGQVNGYYGLAQSLEALDDLPGALGAMRSFMHLSAEDDPFRRRALAAIWEWQSVLEAAGAKGASLRTGLKSDSPSAGESGADPQP